MPCDETSGTGDKNSLHQTTLCQTDRDASCLAISGASHLFMPGIIQPNARLCYPATMKPDSPIASVFIASPNHDARAGDAVDILLLHYTGMASGIAAQQRLCAADATVSSHYLVFEDGEIIQLVRETRRAYHAGVSSWQGASDINSRSIGIEIVNGSHDFGCPDFPSPQIDPVIRLCRDIQLRWPIPQDRVLAHSDVAPERKRDPGEKFPWRVLHTSGIGLWIEPEPISDGITLTLGDRSDGIVQLKTALREHGYAVDSTDRFDTALQDVVIAFQRHFRPQHIDGIADLSTLRTLDRLLDARRNPSSQIA